MNWKLITQLSMFGLGMGIATVFVPDSPRLMMALIGPVIGVVSGLVLELFAIVASKLVTSRTRGAAPNR